MEELGIDLAAIASAAGLGGAGGSAALALAFAGAVKKFIIRTLTTAVFTGVGFYLLLTNMGFQIVPKEQAVAEAVEEEAQAGFPSIPGLPGGLEGILNNELDGAARPESMPRADAPVAAAEPQGAYVICAPWRACAKQTPVGDGQ
ncbi:MAG: hypothetical protein AAGJ32_03675 [Pseudomonadota bacterium]